MYIVYQYEVFICITLFSRDMETNENITTVTTVREEHFEKFTYL